MNDDELLRDVRVRLTLTHIIVEARLVEEKAERWALAALLRRSAPAWEVERARRMALADYRFFRVCDTCRERFPAHRVTSHPNGTDHCADCFPQGV